MRDYHEHVTNLLLGKQYYASLQTTALDHLQIDGQVMTGYGLLQSDYTVSMTSTKVLTLEIKPKYAISNGSTCDFCLHSYWKQARKEKEFIEDFCPFDLYSLDPWRMTRSLMALSNHSRLKIFYNGVYDKGSDGILHMYSSKQEYFKDVVQILVRDPILKRLNQCHVHARNKPLRKLMAQDQISHKNLKQLLETLETFHVQDLDVKKFLISKSLMDVSIMIRIENNFSPGSEKIGDYYYTIGVIDVQPKDIEKLLLYSKTEQEIFLLKGIRACNLL